MSIDAMKQALEALENAQENFGTWWPEPIAALRLAIEQAERQEPVAWGVDWGKAGDIPCVSIIKRLADGGMEVVAVEYAPYAYTAPPQRQPLTEEEIWREYQALWPFHPQEEPRLAADMATFARAIERAHGIGGGV